MVLFLGLCIHREDKLKISFHFFLVSHVRGSHSKLKLLSVLLIRRDVLRKIFHQIAQENDKIGAIF